MMQGEVYIKLFPIMMNKASCIRGSCHSKQLAGADKVQSSALYGLDKVCQYAQIDLCN